MGRPKGSKNGTRRAKGSEDVTFQTPAPQPPTEVAAEPVEKKTKRTAEVAFADLVARGRTPQQIRAIAVGRDDEKLAALADTAINGTGPSVENPAA